jgi:hypothetical protein
MNREATEKLKLDRRLLNRRGWASKAELEAALASLPDVSHKIAPPEEESPGSDAETASGDPGAAPVPPRVE